VLNLVYLHCTYILSPDMYLLYDFERMKTNHKVGDMLGRVKYK